MYSEEFLVLCVSSAICTTLLLSTPVFTLAVASDLHQEAQIKFKARLDDRDPWHRKSMTLQSIPRWEPAHMQQPLCAPDSDFTHGKFYKTEQDDLVYEPKDCRLRRLSADDARRFEFYLGWQRSQLCWSFLKRLKCVIM